MMRRCQANRRWIELQDEYVLRGWIYQNHTDHKVDSYVHPTFWGKVEAYTGFGFDIAKDIIEARYYLNPTAIQITNPTAAIRRAPTSSAHAQ